MPSRAQDVTRYIGIAMELEAKRPISWSDRLFFHRKFMGRTAQLLQEGLHDPA